MKAIYINLDPYLAAFATWLKGGKSGPAPSFDPLPLAVTIPLGEGAAYLSPIHNSKPIEVTIDGQTLSFIGPEDSPIATDQQIPGLSALAPNAYYSVEPISGNDNLDFTLTDGTDEISIRFRVLVRRETASGPVDLVDFTPPAAAIAAGTDLKGTKFNGNEIVAAAGTGALSAPAGS